MRVLFTYENTLPNRQADAEVFTSTARHLAAHLAQAWLHVPVRRGFSSRETAGLQVVRAIAPLRVAPVRHFCAGLTLPWRRAFRAADLVYTRNLWVAIMAILAGQRVVFDHYRPWPDQVPPLQPLVHWLFGHRRFLLNICHSDYTRRKYLELGVAPEKLVRIHNGFDPARFAAPVPVAAAKRAIGVAADERTVVYTGRVNGRKGLELVLAAAARLPDVLFILVGSEGEGPIEAAARGMRNVRVVPWQDEAGVARYIQAADVLLIPPSRQPLAAFGSTVLPLKLFLYLGSGRPVLAGRTPDVAEVLRHGETALLVEPDSVPALVEGIGTLLADPALAEAIAARAAGLRDAHTWAARAQAILAAVTARLEAPALTKAPWDQARRRTWRRESWLWLKHAIVRRRVILPPRGLEDAAGAGPGRQPAQAGRVQ